MISFLKTCVLCVLLYLSSATVCVGQQVAPPQDSTKFYFTVFTHADWQSRPNEVALLSIVNSEPVLTLKNGCHFNHYTTNDPVYVAGRFWNIPESEFPVVLICDPAGGYFYKASGKNIPTSAKAMFDGAKSAYERDKEARGGDEWVDLPIESQFNTQDCPDGKCPLPAPRTPAVDRDPVFPNAPWNSGDTVDTSIEGLFGGDTPVRDSLGYMAVIGVGVLFMFFLAILFCGAVAVALVTAWLFKR